MREVDFTDADLYVDWIEEITEALYDQDIRYIFLKWGAGAGKSYSMAQLIIQNVLDWVRIWWFRKVANSLKSSMFQLSKDVISDWSISDLFEIRSSVKEIEAKHGVGLLNMFGLDDSEKIKSIANYDWFWLEETTEFTYDDFTQLDLRLRWWTNQKIICTFNPISSRHWLKTAIYDKHWDNAVWIMKTAWDNKFVGEQYLKLLDELKFKNEKKYKIYALNQWGDALEWAVFPDYFTFQHDIEPEVMGLDFWWNDPNALTYLKREDVQWEKKRLYIQEKVFKREQTADDLIAEMGRIWVPKNILILADSARPEMIAAIKQAWYRIEWVKKYWWCKADFVQNMKQYEIYLNWDNCVREFSWYMWKKDKDWKVDDVPEDGDDHTVDWSLYWCTHFSKPQEFYFTL